MGERLFLSGFPAILALEEIRRQTLAVPKDALVGNVPVELIPFSDLNSRANKYVLELSFRVEWVPGKYKNIIISSLKRVFCLS